VSQSKFLFPERSKRDTLALTLCAGVGSAICRRRIVEFGSAEHALDCTVGAVERESARAEADRLMERGAAIGAGLLIVGEDGFPERLDDLPDPPALLWYIGQWETLTNHIVAIVGTRRATSYGERITRELATAFAHAGACVVSVRTAITSQSKTTSARACAADAIHTLAARAAVQTAAVLRTTVLPLFHIQTSL